MVGHVAEEQGVAAAELAFGEAVRRKRTGEQLDQRDEDRQLGAVEGEQAEGDLLPDGEVVLPVEGLGDPADGYGKDLGAELEGGGQHPQKRQ